MRRILIAALFLALAAVSANAYTVIMRDGRRVQIPDQFTVTSSTLTYDAGRGMQVTIQLNTVDIAATEKANGEAPGALLLRASTQQADQNLVNQTRPRAVRSVTNKDLEEYRQARVEGEQKRKELGLPSMEDRRRETAVIEERTQEQVRNLRAQQEMEEAYQREREALRSQAAANDAQMDYLRQRVDDLNQWSPYSTVYPIGYGPFGTFGVPFGTGFGFGRDRFGRFGRFGHVGNPFINSPFPQFGFNIRAIPRDFRRPTFRAPRVNQMNQPRGGGHMRGGGGRR